MSRLTGTVRTTELSYKAGVPCCKGSGRGQVEDTKLFSSLSGRCEELVRTLANAANGIDDTAALAVPSGAIYIVMTVPSGAIKGQLVLRYPKQGLLLLVVCWRAVAAALNRPSVSSVHLRLDMHHRGNTPAISAAKLWP